MNTVKATPINTGIHIGADLFDFVVERLSIQRISIEEGVDALELADANKIQAYKHEDGSERFLLSPLETVIYTERGTFLKVSYQND